MTVKVDISYGELLDKISILEIKLEHAIDAAQLANIRSELDLLTRVRRDELRSDPDLDVLCSVLESVNRRLWNIEDNLRDCERRGDFGPRFIELARSVYVSNDERAAIKRRINELLNCSIVEEKIYDSY